MTHNRPATVRTNRVENQRRTSFLQSEILRDEDERLQDVSSAPLLTTSKEKEKEEEILLFPSKSPTSQKTILSQQQEQKDRERNATDIIFSFLSTLNENNGFIFSSSQDHDNDDERSTINSRSRSSTNDSNENIRIPTEIINSFHEHVEFIDTSLYKPILGKGALLHQIQQNPTFLFHVNTTTTTSTNTNVANEQHVLPFIKVKYVQTSPDPYCPLTDVKVAVLYECDYHKNSTSLQIMEKKYGITFYTISDGKILKVFDVKEGIKEQEGEWSVLENHHGHEDTYRCDSIENKEEKTDDVVSAFIHARNNQNLDHMMKLLSSSNFMFKSNIGVNANIQGNSKSPLNSLMLPENVTILVEEFVASPTKTQSTNNEEETSDKVETVGIRWVLCRNGERQRFSRGCSFFRVLNHSTILSMIDIFESPKKYEFDSEVKLTTSRANWLRDSGIARSIVDTLTLVSSPALLLDENTPKGTLSDFAKLSQDRVHLQYGSHSSQFVDLFLPKDEDQRRGLIFFVHGGAWGTGQPWMYRLTATPFLEANMAVAIVGYRTYPCGNVQDQIDDLESASKAIVKQYPHLDERPKNVKETDWIGVSLVGHSSGTHIALLKLIQRIESVSTLPSPSLSSFLHTPQKETNMRNEIDQKKTLHFDTMIGLAGVYSIGDHFDFECGRGVDEISPMKPACLYTMDKFNEYSPAARLTSFYSSRDGDLLSIKDLPDMLLIHGSDDDVVPLSSATSCFKIMKSLGYVNLNLEILKKTKHEDTVIQLMFGGPTHDIVMEWLLRKNKINERVD